jgi:hypothetical protein
MDFGVDLIAGDVGVKLGSKGVRAIMGLAASVGGVSATQHYVLFQPNDLAFEIGIGEVVGDLLRNAMFCRLHHFDWDDLWIPE